MANDIFFNMKLKTLVILAILILGSLNQISAVVTAPPDLAKGVPAADIEKVQRIFQKFTAAIGKEASDYTLEVHKNDELNAYATLGKKIVINSALIEQIQSESALALVIAHELGHVERKHVIKGIFRNSLSSIMKYYVFKQNQLLNGVDYMHTLYYDRSKEREADYYAIDLIDKVYCKTPGKLEFFEMITQGKKNSKLQEYFSTHPLPETRIIYLKEEIQKANCVI